jgi:mannose-1-phosphate guanylyltransferase
MQAVILAGGLGTRLHPMTLTLPKALVPVQGLTLTDKVIELLKEAGVTEVFLAIGHLREQIKDYYGNGKKQGIKIKYFIEEKPLGTGGWMHEAKGKLKGDFFVVNGDNLFDIDFKKFIAFHKKQKAIVSIALTKVADPTSFGIAKMEKQNITTFVEKPKREDAPSDLANSGYYLFNEKVFDEMPQEEKFMLEKELFPKLAEKNLLCGFPSNAQWFDTGTLERLEKVNKEWRRR